MGASAAAQYKHTACVQSLTEAFLEWREAASYQKEVQTKLAACLQRWRLNSLAAAFDAFSANVLKMRKAKMVRDGCIRSMCFAA